MSFLFLFHNRDQVRLAAKSINALRQRGHEVDVFDLEQLSVFEGAREACQNLFGEPSHPVSMLDSVLSPGSIAVICNDWPPKWSPWLNIVPRLRERGSVLVGLIDGCRWAQSDRYRVVDYILSYAPAAQDVYASRALPRPVRVVGSPIIENSLSQRPEALIETDQFALINYKLSHKYYGYSANPAWLTSVLEACRAVGLQGIVSCHPRTKFAASKENAITADDVSKAILQAAVVISPPSTIVIEALAHSVPVVLFPNGSEILMEFSEPLDAFEIVQDANALASAIENAVSSRSHMSSKACRFLERHLSVDNDRPAHARITDALEEVLINERLRSKHPRGRLEFRPVWELKSNTGSTESDVLVCRPGIHQEGHCAFGLDYTIRKTSQYRAVFELESSPGISADSRIAHLDIYETSLLKSVLAEFSVRNSTPHREGYRLEFLAYAGQTIEFRVFWYGKHQIKFSGVYLEEIVG